MTADETFSAHRPLLFSIAYRMLGSVMDAEDAIQESYLRWRQAATEQEIAHPKAFLATTITRLSIDKLRQAQRQRETYPGVWLPEPIFGSPPGEGAELTESLSLAFLTVLESLTPIERAVFLLHEVFDYEYGEIARIVEKSEANCRQILRRARNAVHERRPRFQVAPEQHNRLLAQFMETCARGDLDGLLALLADDATHYSDGGGKAVGAALRPIVSSDKVARFLFGLLRKATPEMRYEVEIVNGQTAVVIYLGERLYSVLAIDTDGVHIRRLYGVVNPDKLGR